MRGTVTVEIPYCSYNGLQYYNHSFDLNVNIRSVHYLVTLVTNELFPGSELVMCRIQCIIPVVSCVCW